MKYANSGDVTGDKSRVVGYSSILIYIPDDVEKKGELIMESEYLTKEEKEKLLEIAKFSIKELLLVKALKLAEVKKLNDSYLHLKYDVINDTNINI